MTQYVLQIQKDIVEGSVTKGILNKCYEVTEEYPIRPAEQIPDNRIQIVITDTTLFNNAVAAYNVDTINVQYTWDDPNLTWKTI
jgi:hypothetical protein